MTIWDRIDPEQMPALVEMLQADLVDLTDIPGTRARLEQQRKNSKPVVVPADITTEDHLVPAPHDDPDVLVRLYFPEDRTQTLPGLLYIHGGGYILGSIEDDDVNMRIWAKEIGCVVASVEYRLAPENPFPAPLEDCYTGLKWFSENATELGVDPARIAIAGTSAGGGLAAGLALLARDRGEVNLCFQLLAYPMIDDRMRTPSSQNAEIPNWTVEQNRFGWKAYLGNMGQDSPLFPYAVPAHATDLKGLPPAYIFVGEIDLFLDETIEYAQRLLQAGVRTELHVFPGSVHAFDLMAKEASISQYAANEQLHALKKILWGRV